MKDTSGRRHDLTRMALRLHEQISASQGPVLVVLPEPKWRECQRLVRLHEKAVWKGWLPAAERVRPRMEKALRDLQHALTMTLDRQKQQPPVSRLSTRELYAELASLFEEFDEVECDLRGRTVSVVTEPVTLDGVDLGPFRIELDVNGGDGRSGYTVTATDPNPAACDGEVTHPHVRDGCLCEGEGTLPIRRALKEGRLGDFFQIVTQVLHTYNPGSAYVELDEWEGVACVACGTSVFEDEQIRCWASAEPLCCECAVTCENCGHDFAPDRTDICQKCDEPFCTHCLDEGLCRECREKAQGEVQATQQPTEPAPGRCGGLAADGEPAEPVGTKVA